MSSSQYLRFSKKSRGKDASIVPQPKRRNSSGISSNVSGRPRDLTTLLLNRRHRLADAVPVGGDAVSNSHPSRPSGPPVPTGSLRVPRRGIFYASELIHTEDAREWDTECHEIERVCVIRFPPWIASILQERLAMQLEMELMGVGDEEEEEKEKRQKARDHPSSSSHLSSGSRSSSVTSASISSPQISKRELGLTITPTAKEDYRVFDVEVEKELGDPTSAILLTGVLVELPCLVEAYKSFEGDLLFKANDISQMLYVFDATAGATPFDLQRIRDEQLWEWQSGLTPATHRIRRRKFKNFRVFDKADVGAKERELFGIINQSSHRELAVLEASTEEVCEKHLEGLQSGSGLESNVAGIVGPENPILKAALDHKSPSAVMEPGQHGALGQTTLKNLLHPDDGTQDDGTEHVFSGRLEEKLKFSLDANMNLTQDDVIQDDLSDRMFGDYGLTEEEEDDIALEDDYQLDEMSSLMATHNNDLSSSESSLSSSDGEPKSSKVSRS